MARADAAMEREDWAEAVTAWRAILAKRGQETPVRVHLGLTGALRRMGQHRAAIESAEVALARYPDHVPVLVEAAEAAEALHDWPRAIAAWESVTTLPTKSPRAHLRLASLLVAEGDLARARDILASAAEHYGETTAILAARAEIELSLGLWSDARGSLACVLSHPEASEAQRNAARIGMSIAERLENRDEMILAARRHRAEPQGRRVAVYSACISAYDTAIPPAKLNDRFDYVMFTDGVALDCGGFTIRPAPFLHRDPVRSARFVKTHPHWLLEGYDVAIWVDSSIVLLEDLDDLVQEFVRSGCPVAGVPHQHRSRLSEEFEACIARGKDDPDVIERQRAAYAAAGFECADLVETGWMMFNLRDPRCARFLDAWWTEIETHSRRDQLSVNFAMRQADVAWHRLIAPPQSIRDNPYVALAPHGPSKKATRLVEAMGATIFDPFAGPAYSESRERRIAAVTMPIDVVVCVHNAHEDVQRCLASIDRHRRGENVRLVLVDDGSAAETRDYLAGFGIGRDWVRLIRNDAAVGYSRAARQGVGESRADVVIVLNSDTIVTDGWAEKLADALLSTKGAGIVGPLSNAAGRQSIPGIKGSGLQTAVNALPVGVDPDAMNRYCEAWTVDGLLPRVSLIHGFCLGIHRAVLDKVDFFDVENFPRGYGEEDDFCLRAGAAGFGLVIATHTFVYHAKSRSFATAERLELMRQGPATLMRLHGADRVKRAMEAAPDNAILERIRQNAYGLYRTPWPALEKAPA